MAIAETIKRIEDSLDSNLDNAEIILSEALKNPEFQNSFKIILLNAQYLLRRKRYNEAVEEVNKALKIAFEHGKRSQIAEAINLKAIAYFRSKDFPHAFECAVRACHFDDLPNSEIKMFKNIVQTKYLKEGNVTEDELNQKEQELLSKPSSYDISLANTSQEKRTKPASTDPKSSFNIEKATISQNLRTDWFDSGKNIELSIYVKKIKDESVVLEIVKDSLRIAFDDSNGAHYEYLVNKLFDEIDDTKSSYKVYGTKLAIFLVKKNDRAWKSLEATNDSETVTSQIPKDEIVKPIAYPSSSKKKIEWSKFDIDEDEDDEAGSPEDFFKKLYDGADPDAKRAMMKSFMESNGTSLSTDWKDVGSRKVDPYVDGEDN